LLSLSMYAIMKSSNIHLMDATIAVCFILKRMQVLR
jgi:hypothetical protein